MEELLVKTMTEGKEISFALLFVGMLIWTMKNNKERDVAYQQTIANLSKTNQEEIVYIRKDVKLMKTNIINLTKKMEGISPCELVKKD